MANALNLWGCFSKLILLARWGLGRNWYNVLYLWVLQSRFLLDFTIQSTKIQKSKDKKWHKIPQNLIKT